MSRRRQHVRARSFSLEALRRLPELLPIVLLLILLAVVMLAGCDSADDGGFDVADYLGTYAGTETISLLPGLPTPVRHTFTSDAAGQVTLTTVYDVQDERDPRSRPIVLMGTVDANGMRFEQTDAGAGAFGSLTVDADGQVDGVAEVVLFDAPVEATVTGTLTPERLDLDITFEVPPGLAGLPAGTTVTLQQRTQRV